MQATLPIQDDFDIFWAAYPKRPGNPKAPAREEWAKLTKTGALPPLERMIQAARAYTMHCVKHSTLNSNYVAHTRTWLHQKRWEEWAPPAALGENPGTRQAVDILPLGFEDIARRVIDRFGVLVWRGWFGKAQWSRDDQGLVITVQGRFDAHKIQTDFAEAIEAMSGQGVWIKIGPRNATEPTGSKVKSRELVETDSPDPAATKQPYWNR